MPAYPQVLDEFATLAAVHRGRSLARFGDGEFNLAIGVSIPCQRLSDRLRIRLTDILRDSVDCLIGIPNLHSGTPKESFWRKYHATADLLADHTYGSAFVSRPDSAPWINTPDYWQMLESLWVGQAVTIVRGVGSEKGLQKADLIGASSVCEVLCPRKDAFADYDNILAMIGTPATALLCLGPTATVLAVDLCARGVHAIDLGHVALFLRKYRRGEAMALTKAEKAAA